MCQTHTQSKINREMRRGKKDKGWTTEELKYDIPRMTESFLVIKISFEVFLFNILILNYTY